MAHKVFISCKSEDYHLAQNIYNFLIDNGFETFLASESLRKIGNTQYLNEIDAALDECNYMIVFCTKAKYTYSEFVREEWQSFRNEKLSRRKDGNILTIIGKDVKISDLPYGLRSYEVVNFNEFRNVLLNYVGGKVVQKNQEIRPNHKSKWLWILFSVFLVFGVIFGIMYLNNMVFTGKDVGNRSFEITNPVSDGSNDTTIVYPIDLGLPSGTLWADKNVGAKNVGDLGSLYSWGCTERKSAYYDSLYNRPQGNSIIGSTFDVAHETLGGNWKMPTKDQFEELIQCCKWEWENGFYQIIGKNGNYIIMPAAGWCCNGKLINENVYGYYYSGELNENQEFVYGLLFNKSNIKIGQAKLSYGRSIRAVCYDN